ncbi:MAG TPA: TIGR04283 family arsenosugar biosynthesis glycosyltransferase [Burkholderiales bacterium]|nr:TIGR04283 family arsenosugar biosynthesis glycosyltransferase [Burkholderiales bacterium]
MARLSIVMPVLNEATEIVGALERLQPLRARGHEVIVVDGGSGDDTMRLAAPLADRVLQAPRGRARQMNAGAGHARGDVLLFLHADTRLPQDADRLIAEPLAGSAAAWGRFDVAIDGRHPLLRVIAAAMNLRSRATGICTGDQGIFVHRALFRAIGGYADIELMEDIALTRLLRRHAPPACPARRAVTSGRRWERRGVWRTMALMWWLRLRYFLGASPARLRRLYEGERT